MSVPELCRLFGVSKQAFYKRRVQNCKEDEREIVRKLVMDIRSKLPKTGGRKLYYLLKERLQLQGIKLGRDKLFSFLRKEHLLVIKRKKYHKTTNSRHWMRKYPNLIKQMVINRPEQVWVADITYLQAAGKHHYLHLITDACSKKIVGYKLADNLQTQSTLEALTMALSNRRTKLPLIHHSDRGLQYCSGVYTEALKAKQVSISMTENYDPYENAVAERVNGILKDEFYLQENFETIKQMDKQVKQAICFYNQLRPHLSIEMQTPNQAHQKKGIKLKSWQKTTPLSSKKVGSLFLS